MKVNPPSSKYNNDECKRDVKKINSPLKDNHIRLLEALGFLPCAAYKHSRLTHCSILEMNATR
jgi:hypothetical protein